MSVQERTGRRAGGTRLAHPRGCEFVVDGEPISKQNPNRAGSKRRWQERVNAAARAALGGDIVPYGGELSVLVVYFFVGQTDRDLDNIAKPILDGMNHVVYHDDRQICHLVLRKTEQAMMSGVKDLPVEVVTRLGRRGRESFVYIRIEDGPDHRGWPVALGGQT
jgi:hypothetical protein